MSNVVQSPRPEQKTGIHVTGNAEEYPRSAEYWDTARASYCQHYLRFVEWSKRGWV